MNNYYSYDSSSVVVNIFLNRLKTDWNISSLLESTSPFHVSDASGLNTPLGLPRLTGRGVDNAWIKSRHICSCSSLSQWGKKEKRWRIEKKKKKRDIFE